MQYEYFVLQQDENNYKDDNYFICWWPHYYVLRSDLSELGKKWEK